MNDLEQFFQNKLNKRNSTGHLRTLKHHPHLIDFCSNDYLGLANNEALKNLISQAIDQHTGPLYGSTGSRLISGHYPIFNEAEEFLAKFHHAEAALLFNSGYAANLAVFSTIPQKGDTVLYDELCHACIKDGIRLSFAEKRSFKHNNLSDLKVKLGKAIGRVFIAIESVYSMDGDEAPLKEIASLAKEFDATIIVDEAHSTGIMADNGEGATVFRGLSKDIAIRIHTFGKAIGAHGAVVVGSENLKNYLINFARPFIYTTALPVHSVVCILESYKYLTKHVSLLYNLHQNIEFFKEAFLEQKGITLIDSQSAIQALVLQNTESTLFIANQMQNAGFDVRAILSPTVPKGSERIRICMHAFNTKEQISDLCSHIKSLI